MRIITLLILLPITLSTEAWGNGEPEYLTDTVEGTIISDPLGRESQSENQSEALNEQEALNEDPEAQRRAQLAEEQASEESSREKSEAREEEAALNEDPEAQRRARVTEEPELRDLLPTVELYGSVRLHAINNFNEDNELTEFSLGDGASRVGIRGEWGFFEKHYLFGRAEGGFDVLDTFTTKAGNDEDKEGITPRLAYGGYQSDNLMLVYGKNWSTYYQIAGMADRFSIFGGSAAGVYNARTDGGSSGTGRADGVLQARYYTPVLEGLHIKPFNLNVQYQNGESIPHTKNAKYGRVWSLSGWLETEADHGVGVAYHRGDTGDPENPELKAAGIDGDMSSLALSLRDFGDNWYGALVVTLQKNLETTDQLKYIDGIGAELYLQWQFRDNWWLVGGGNWLRPDSDDPDAGEYEVLYGVLGLRYTLDSFNRMLYAELRLDKGTLADGTARKSEFTIGFRWDFGYRN